MIQFVNTEMEEGEVKEKQDIRKKREKKNEVQRKKFLERLCSMIYREMKFQVTLMIRCSKIQGYRGKFLVPILGREKQVDV